MRTLVYVDGKAVVERCEEIAKALETLPKNWTTCMAGMQYFRKLYQLLQDGVLAGDEPTTEATFVDEPAGPGGKSQIH